MYLAKTKSRKLQRTVERGFDYSDVNTHDNQTNVDPDYKVLHVKLGKPTSIKCESAVEFDNCKFKDPTGNIHEIGIGGGSYNKKRVDCLCTEEEYDPTKVCGIYISKTKMEDKGEWSCIMEFDKNGIILPEIVVKVLHVQSLYDLILGGFVPDKGGYIVPYKKEVDIKPEQLIKELPSLGSEYQIKFQLFISKSKDTEEPYNILTITVDKGMDDENNLKYGDRNPAVYVKGKELIIQAAVNFNPKFETKVPLTVGKWMKIEICQHIIKNELTYEVKINKKSVKQEVQKVPCLFKGVTLWGGKPGSVQGNVKAKIRALFFSTSDEENQGKCLVDFRPTPLPPTGNLMPNKTEGPEGPVDPNGVYGTGVDEEKCEAEPEELCLKKNQLITVLPYIGKEFTITFELYLYSYQPLEWYSVLHFTRSGNNNTYGDRNPAIMVSGSGHGYNPHKIVVFSSVNGNANLHVYPEKKYPLKTWIPFKISQKMFHGPGSTLFVFDVVIDGKRLLSQTNSMPAELTDVKVYGGDPWYPAQQGKIRKLFLETEGDGPCICKANAESCRISNISK